MITMGVDAGTRFLKLCLVDGEDILGLSYREMGGDFKKIYRHCLDDALLQASAVYGKKISPRSIKKTIATGFASQLVKRASYTLKEPGCIARAVSALKSDIHTVLDAGALFLRIISIDNKGFLLEDMVNEKCAAGSGRFLETIAAAAGVDFEDISLVVKNSRNPYTISSSCAVFAESEVISQVGQGVLREDILAGVVKSIASKSMAMLQNWHGRGPLCVTGGLARVDAFINSLHQLAGRDIVQLDIDPRLIAAYGAALLAQKQGT